MSGTRPPGTVPPLASSPLLEGPPDGRRAWWAFVRHVLAHPYNLLFLGTFLLASLMGASVLIFLLTVAVEAAVLVVVPRTPWLRRSVEDQLRGRERRSAAAVRAALAADLDVNRRQELVELEERVATIRSNTIGDDGRSGAMLDQMVGLDRLLGSFVRLAVIHRATRESLGMTDREALAEEIAHLEERYRRATTVRVRNAVGRQLTLARRRLSWVDKNRQRLEAMDHQLSAIAEMVRLVHEHSVALLDAGDAADVIERVVLDLEQHEQALSELVAVCLPEDDLAEETFAVVEEVRREAEVEPARVRVEAAPRV